jgi:hypothetical protein
LASFLRGLFVANTTRAAEKLQSFFRKFLSLGDVSTFSAIIRQVNDDLSPDPGVRNSGTGLLWPA